MIRCSGWLAVAAIALAAPVVAQVSDLAVGERLVLPEAPADHVLDEAELFKRHPERREAISERLMALEDTQGLPVYLAVYGTILDTSLPQRARALFDRWIGPDRDGIVIAYEADSVRYEIVRPSARHARPASESSPDPRIPDYRMVPILAELRVTLEGVEDRVDYIDRTVEILALRVDAMLREDAAASGGNETLKSALIAVGIGIVIAIVGYFANRRLHVLDERTRARFYFPEVMVGTRLGAPYSGGRHSVVEFTSTFHKIPISSGDSAARRRSKLHPPSSK